MNTYLTSCIDIIHISPLQHNCLGPPKAPPKDGSTLKSQCADSFGDFEPQNVCILVPASVWALKCVDFRTSLKKNRKKCENSSPAGKSTFPNSGSIFLVICCKMHSALVVHQNTHWLLIHPVFRNGHQIMLNC